MESVTQFAILSLTTTLAGAVAFGMVWAFLRGAFQLMQPASASRRHEIGSGLVQGTRASAQQQASRR